MPLDLPTFTKAFNRARDRIRGSAQPVDVAAEQEKLRALVPADASEHDHQWTSTLIAGLADPPPPAREWSDLYHEAGRIQAAAYPASGTLDDQIAALAEARQKILKISEQAAEDEEADIWAMAASLGSLEALLRDPPFPLDDTPPGTMTTDG